MQSFVVPITAREATETSRFGPKAANLARLGQAQEPLPHRVARAEADHGGLAATLLDSVMGCAVQTTLAGCEPYSIPKQP